MWMRAPGQEKERAQYIAWANALVGLQEQTELQPFIVAAFPAPFNFTWGNHTIEIDVRPACTRMITLILAVESVFPTQDMTPRLSDGQLWAPYLVDVTLSGYAAVYTSLVKDAGGPGFDSAKGTAANDWSHLDQRMRFIVPTMRSRYVIIAEATSICV